MDANRRFHYLGRRDDELNTTGLEQARALAVALGEVPFGAVISSPQLRALETARAIAAPAGVDIGVDSRLVELDFGTWEGRSRAEVMSSGEENRRVLAEWEGNPAMATPGGESLVDVQTRVVELADDLSRLWPAETVVLVSHMGPIKVLLCAALGLPLQSAGRIFLDPATVSVVEWGERPLIRLVNSHAHLGFAGARWLRGD